MRPIVLLILLSSFLVALAGCKRESASPARQQSATTRAIANDTGDWIGFHGADALTGVAPAIAGPPMQVRWVFRTEQAEPTVPTFVPAKEPDIVPSSGPSTASSTAPATTPSTAPATTRAALSPPSVAPSSIEGSAAIVGDVVYIADTSGGLHALDIQTGKPRWSLRGTDGFGTTPLVVGGRVFIGDLGGMFYAVDAETGKQIWAYDSGSAIHSSANYFDDWGPPTPGNAMYKRMRSINVVFGNDGADIYCLRASDGKEIWDAKAGDRVNGAPAVAGGSVFVSGCDAQLRALKLEDGTEKYATDIGALAPGSPAVVGDQIVIGTDQGRVGCFSLSTGEKLWLFEGIADQAMVYASPAVAGGIAVVGARDRSVYALDMSNGKKKWSFAARGDVDASPVISDGRVYIACKDKHLYVLDLKSGKLLWDFNAGRPMTASPAIGRGVIVIGDNGGTVRCLGR